ncbi:MAG: thymidine phosphorylase, partial [Candidatus Saccharimonas sp.]|nr:thymidine phosphorylase [Planctomycetaceae bacterium]
PNAADDEAAPDRPSDDESTAVITVPNRSAAEPKPPAVGKGTNRGKPHLKPPAQGSSATPLRAGATLLLDGSERIDSRPELALGGRDTVEIEDVLAPPRAASNVETQSDTSDFPLPAGARLEFAATDHDTIDLGNASHHSHGKRRPFSGPVVDKHSTGGLGDKVSLILAPLLACCGLRVPMISGRGLGATGGTLDKLESIPGFRTQLTLAEISKITDRVGCVITGASAELAPIDGKLYALRDVTATVESIPLITASIMSKKLAEGLNALVLDVKYGSGAFMKTLGSARKLAASLVETGQRMGVKTSALLTNMDQPLGRMVGNTLEVDEALATLTGNGPSDLWEVTCELGADLLLTTGKSPDRPSARKLLEEHLNSGRALAKFIEMVAAQGGNLNAPRPRATTQSDIISPRSGYVSRINTEALGIAVIELGGGRRVMSDRIDHGVGLEMLVRIGDRVELGQPLVRVYAPDNLFQAVKPLIRNAILIRAQTVKPPILISERMD